MMPIRCGAALWGAVMLGGLLGCQSEDRPAGMPELHPVRITVVQDGTPLADASIRLIPQDSGNPWSSGGSTDSQGVAEIRTHGKYRGVPEGTYQVTISKIEMPAAAPVDRDPLAPPPTSGASYDLVAAEYAYPNQTPLQITVTAGENREEFDLGPAVRIQRSGPPTP